MSKKLYHIGFDKIRNFTETRKKEFRSVIHQKDSFALFARIGKCLYEIEIFDYFKLHKINKEPKKALMLMEHFLSEQFIIRTLQESGLYALLFISEKQNGSVFLNDYFFACVYMLNELDSKKDICRPLFELNFIHHSPMYSSRSGISSNPEAMVRHILKPKLPKESFGEDENGAYFKIIFDSKTYINLSGKSIKTLRKKAYKEFLQIVLDEKLK